MTDLDAKLNAHARWLAGEPGGVRLDLAVGLYAVLRDEDLRGVNFRGANLGGADLAGADLRGADLRRANLRGADLRGADMRGADMRGADMHDADLRGIRLSRGLALVARALRSDGQSFAAWASVLGPVMIGAGCRWMSIDAYREHAATYDDEGKRAETLAILGWFEDEAARSALAIEGGGGRA